jgi:hypothetical protein
MNCLTSVSKLPKRRAGIGSHWPAAPPKVKIICPCTCLEGGRPRKRWLDDLEEDLRKLGVKGWRRKAEDREEWRNVVNKAEVLHGL